jgi:sugar lactone lactonase YvrE
MSVERDVVTISEGHTYLEAPRWHDGRLLISDLYTHRVVSLREDGTDLQVEASLDVPPAGIGWLPDGTLLVTATQSQQLLRRVRDGSLVVHADLSSYARGWVNDFSVDDAGRAYIGHFGFDLFGGEPLQPASILCVDPNGTVRTVADDVYFPNGSAITDDGRLLVGETFGNRVTAFRIAGDGSLTERETWMSFGAPSTSTNVFEVLGEMSVAPDGCAIDAEGALWIADIAHGRIVRVLDGSIVDEVVPGSGVFACALGGEDGRTLFLCCAPDFDPNARAATREGQVRAVRVDIPAP